MLQTQKSYEVPVDLQVQNGTNAMNNIGLIRLSP